MSGQPHLKHRVTGLVVQVVRDHPAEDEITIKSGKVTTTVRRSAVEQSWLPCTSSGKEQR